MSHQSLTDKCAGAYKNFSYAVIGDEVDMPNALEFVEINLLKWALCKAKGNKSTAAQFLRLNRTTFVEKLRRRGIKHG
jgi:DNA-binding protein Fis